MVAVSICCGSLAQAAKAPPTAPNTGSVVIVGASPMLKAMSSVQTRVLKGVREHYVSTMEEAHQYLAEQRAARADS